MNQDTFEYICGFIHQRSAIVVDESKRYLVETRLRPILRAQQLVDINELAEHLRRDPYGSLAANVIDAMSTNETSFFRDRLPFDALRSVVLPELLNNVADHTRINIWSAACSSGQEPFSLAMLLQEHFADQPAGRFHILASDVSEEMLERARSGRFNELEVARGLESKLQQRYFRKEGTHWAIDNALRNRISFRKINLITSWPTLPPIDVVMLRNVLVYFDDATKKRILKNVRTALRPGGYLMLGEAETTIGVDDNFARVSTAKCSCYRLV